MNGVRALWIVAAGVAELREERDLPEVPPRDHLLVRTLYSGISRGTESLVFSGRVPQSEWQSMRAPFQDGDFPFPVKYGYANVGEVIAGPAQRVGQRVFCLYPHQEQFVIDSENARPIPDEIPSQRAILAANMETALNSIWDAQPMIGDTVTVVGAGVVGLMLAAALSRLPFVAVELVDVLPERASLAKHFGAKFALPEAASADRDIVFHTSATGAGLARSLELCRSEGKVIELSWYGNVPVSVPLGHGFHARRLKLLSSQVGRVSPAKVGWTYSKRMGLALKLLDDPRLDALIAPSIPFRRAPEELPGVLDSPTSGPPAVSFAYRS